MKQKITLVVNGNVTVKEDVLWNIEKDNIISAPGTDISALDTSEAVIIHGDVTLGTLDTRNGGCVVVLGDIVVSKE